MTSVRNTPLVRVAAQPKAAPRVAGPVARAPVDAFERKSVTAQLLQRGMTGAKVHALQQRLVTAGFMSANDLRSGPGVYGPRTELAVKRLQASVGLPTTGVAAPSTLAALASGARYEAPPRPTVEMTNPFAARAVLARLAETLTDEVTQPMGNPLASGV